LFCLSRSKEALDDFGKRRQAESSVPIDTVGEGKGDFEKRKRMETSEMEKAAELLAIMKAPTTVCNARGRITKKLKGKSSTIARVPIASTASDKTVKAPTITSNTFREAEGRLYRLPMIRQNTANIALPMPVICLARQSLCFG
jgi:hypothetical protein